MLLRIYILADTSLIFLSCCPTIAREVPKKIITGSSMCDRHFPVVLDSTSSLNECYCQLLPWIPTESVLLESDVFSRIYCHDIYKLYELVSRGLSRDTSKIRGVRVINRGLC